MKPTEAIEAGRKILDPVLAAANFHFVEGDKGKSCGGPFAQASYVKADKRISFSYRFTLGLVTHHVGEFSISHEDYMRHIHKDRESAYVWYSHEHPLNGFEALKRDLEIYFQDFLSGDGDDIRKAACSSRGA